MLRTTRLLAVSALALAGLALAVTPSQAATAPGEAGLAAIGPVTVTATSTGWSHTISGMAAHLCSRSTPALWNAIARANGIADPNRINLGQRIVIRCTSSQPLVTQPQAQLRQPQTASVWVAPLAGTLYVSGNCKKWGPGNHFGANRGDHWHHGIDFSRRTGTPIRALHAGTVLAVGYERGGAGWFVKLAHGRIGDKAMYSTYMHMVRRSFLRTGAHVSAGATIGYVGSTGSSSGPHLHFQVHRGGAYNGSVINPSIWLRAHGIPVRGC